MKNIPGSIDKSGWSIIIVIFGGVTRLDYIQILESFDQVNYVVSVPDYRIQCRSGRDATFCSISAGSS